MSFWKKLFRGDEPQQPISSSIQEPVIQKPEIRESDFIDTNDPNSVESNETTTTTVDFGTGMPIDVIYMYIEQDWENQGFNDASSNPDLKYMNAKIDMIKNNLVHRFELVKMKYDMQKAELNTQMSTANALGLLTSIELINCRLNIIDDHVKKIDKMKQQLDEEDSTMMVMMESYKRGFSNGVAENIKRITEVK